jgi:uncharacterized MAPEG superfamily protein
MTPLLEIASWSVVLGLAQLLIATLFMAHQRGLRWALGPRDEPVPPLSGIAGRLERCLRNFLETFVLFLAATWLADSSGHTGGLVLLGAQLYLWGRVLYVPLYASGVPVVRTLAWAVASAGIVLILAGGSLSG